MRRPRAVGSAAGVESFGLSRAPGPFSCPRAPGRGPSVGPEAVRISKSFEEAHS